MFSTDRNCFLGRWTTIFDLQPFRIGQRDCLITCRSPNDRVKRRIQQRTAHKSERPFIHAETAYHSPTTKAILKKFSQRKFACRKPKCEWNGADKFKQVLFTFGWIRQNGIPTFLIILNQYSFVSPFFSKKCRLPSYLFKSPVRRKGARINR